MRLTLLMRLAPVAILISVAAPLRAEYIVLRSGQRIAVTGYERIGDSYRLQVRGGVVQVAASEIVSIEPQDVFQPLPPAPPEKGPFSELIQSAAQRYGVDADLITSVIAVESNFEPRAISGRNARGLMQLLPETAQRLGVQNIFDPRENIDGGTRYLKELLDRYKNDLVLVLAAYNAGPDRVEQYGDVPPYAETRAYVRRVRRNYEQRKTLQTSPTSNGVAASGTKSKPTASL